MRIAEIINNYRNKIDYLDLELLMAHSLKKTREFILTHPEYKINESQILNIESQILRRVRYEPLAYILGHKEFYGLDFIVNRNVLIPRPETELLVGEVLRSRPKNQIIIDVGTGSGNIIIALAKNITSQNSYIGIDIFLKALLVAKQNARKNKVEKKIKFIRGNLLEPIIDKFKAKNLTKLPTSTREDNRSPASPNRGESMRGGKAKKLVIVANLPYLSKEIYSAALYNVKKFEPKSALFSSKQGLQHYEILFKQINEISKNYKLKSINCIFEFSPEQKKPLAKIIKNIFPEAKTSFKKDLAGKWRVCKIVIR